MKSLMALATVGIMSAALAATAHAEVSVNDSFDFSLSVFVPCANGGAGEIVNLSGPLHELISFTINGNNISGSYHYQPQGIAGVGLSTGAKYQATGVSRSNFKGSLQNGQYTNTYINNFRIVGQGPGNNFLVHETFHMTINADGTLTSFHDNFSTECK